MLWARLMMGLALLALLAGSVVLLDAETGTDGDRKLVERGHDLYRIYCQTCHGETGKGDGPTAEVLKVEPADLTRLSKRNGGKFPFNDVYTTIDGRDELPAHGARTMPIWGLAFQEFDTDVNQEEQVRVRIRQLVHYLKSIQLDADRE